MPDTVSKTDNFLKAIEKYAEEQRSKMQSEAEDFKNRELNIAEEEGLKEAYTMIQKKMADINNRISSDRSKQEAESRRNIFIRRKEIEDEVFEKAKQRLIEFTATDKYISLLETSAKNIAEVLGADDITVCLKKDDLKHKDRIIKALGKNCEFAVSDEIKIGGITGLSRSRGLIADETLDTRLEEQHEWFCENSGLRITE